MLPLLPELLSEPLQVSFQSSPTDWEAVKYEAKANGIGSALGALIGALAGGLISYFSTIRAKLLFEEKKSAQAVYRLARRVRKDLYDIDVKRAANNAVSRNYHNIRHEVESCIGRLDEMCLIIELGFPTEESYADEISNDIRKFFNDRATIDSISHPEARGILEAKGLDPDLVRHEREASTAKLRESIERRMDDLSSRFKKKT